MLVLEIALGIVVAYAFLAVLPAIGEAFLGAITPEPPGPPRPKRIWDPVGIRWVEVTEKPKPGAR